jgi:NADPH:quinone reductase-like Zn-dependent oxidoreductase
MPTSDINRSEQLQIGDAAAQEPQAREVLVGVEAASVNPLDLKIIAGYMKDPLNFPIGHHWRTS